MVSALRIVHVITKGDVGGAQTHVVELSLAQQAAGDEVIVIAGTDGPAMDRIRSAGLGVHVVPTIGESRSKLWQRTALRDLRSVLAEIHPDVVHGHSSNGGLLARLAARFDGYPSVYTAHGWPFQRGAAWSQRVKSFLAEFVGGHVGDAVICLTATEADNARRARVVRRGRLWVIPNGIADVPPELRARPLRDTEAPALVMVARFAPPKLQSGLIAAMADLCDLRWSLTFVGDGPQLASCQEEAGRLVGDRARFLGHRDDVASVLADHDIALLWSRYEGMPIALLEGMRAGLCCIASDLPGVRALFGEPSAGLIATDHRELVSMLRKLLVDPSGIRAFGERARSRYETSYSAHTMEASTKAVYVAVCEQHRTRPTGGRRGLSR